MGIVSDSFKHGLPHEATTIDGAAVVQTKGKILYVNPSSAVGSNGSGNSWTTGYRTMAEAFAVLQSGDTIFLSGKVVEQLVTPVQVFDVRVIGISNRARHADAAPVGGNQATAQWAPTSGGTAAQATVRVLQQGWSFENILFTAIDANAGMIELVRNADGGNSERDASHAVIRNCRFAGAGIGVKAGATSFTELVYNVLLEDNKFDGCTFGIGGAGQFNSLTMRKNVFNQNTNNMDVAVEGSAIYENIFGKFTTQSLELSGGVGTDPNVVTKNYFFGTYSIVGGYKVHHADDEWAGNFNTLGGGITVSDPA